LESRQERPHRLIQIELSFVDEDHRHRRGGHHLGETGEVVERVGRHRRRVRVIGEPAERMEVDEGAAITDRQNATRKGAALAEAVEEVIYLFESTLTETFLLRW